MTKKNSEFEIRNSKLTGLKLNLGCGAKRLDGYVNVDQFGDPDLRFDLETFPYPWDDNSVTEIEMHHVLEHLGQQTQTYKKTAGKPVFYEHLEPSLAVLGQWASGIGKKTNAHCPLPMKFPGVARGE